jgi:hypothetical protein
MAKVFDVYVNGIFVGAITVGEHETKLELVHTHRWHL